MTKSIRLIRLKFRLQRQSLILLLMTSLLLTPSLPFLPQIAHAQPFPPSPQLPAFVGRVCIVPGDSTACPQNMPAIRTIQGQGSLNVSVNILGSTTFNTFNVSIFWDQRVANATGIDLGGTILPAPRILSNCVHGVGLGCTPSEGPGFGHVGVTGGNVTAPAAGRLFKIVFQTILDATQLLVGFRTGCSTSSVPNTSLCLYVATGPTTSPGSVAVPEGVQSQLFGTPLPTALNSVLPPGNIVVNFGGGSTTGFADTYLMPFKVSLPGNITTWKVQFTGGLTGGSTGSPVIPSGVQLKVLRMRNATVMTVVANGTLHDPRPTLISRVPGYPFMTTESTVIEYFSDPGIAVLPGDIIGFTITSNPSVGQYVYPGVTAGPTRFFQSNLLNGTTISLSTPPVLFLPSNSAPALQVFITVPPPPQDTAGDGIPDFKKLGPEMQPLGADPCRKTVAVQLDYMVKPNNSSINAVIASFDNAPVNAAQPCPYLGYPAKSSGIKLIIDLKNQIPFQSVLNFTQTQPQTFDTVKAAFLDPNRARYFHYGIFANRLGQNDTTSGVAEIYGGNFMITMGGWPNGGSFVEQAGTLMHELGHNLGLDHGGNSTINFKANYLSVMNYAFQVHGITTETPTGNVTRFDFSRQALPSLSESGLSETISLAGSRDLTRWVCPDHHHVNIGLVSGPLDWNCNGLTDTTNVSVDINNDTTHTLETLTGYNDWANLRYNFAKSQTFGVGCNTSCDIGCNTSCDIGTELTYPQAAIIEAQWNAFLSTSPHLTSTSTNCPSTLQVNTPSNCTATVTDTSPSSTTTPIGTVSFTSSQGGSFSPSPSCNLTGSGSTASCTVAFTPASTGPQSISGYYPGDTGHFANAGSTTVLVTVESINVSNFFTDTMLNPLPLDGNSNPSVNVVLSRGIVQNTNPGRVLVWLNVTNTGSVPIQSLSLNETLPVDWIISSSTEGMGAVHVYYANTSSLATNPEITQSSTITVTAGNPQTAILAIPSLTATAIGHPLMPGQSILLSVKLSYALVGTSQSPSSYPRNYTDTAIAAAWAQTSFTGSQSTGTASAFFVADAKVVGSGGGTGKGTISL